MLQSSCSPDGSEGLAQLTRWQKLRNLAQTKSLLPASAPSNAIALCGDLNAMLVASLPQDHLAAPGQSCDHLALVLRQPGKLASVRAQTLLQSQRDSTVSDSLDADLQVEAVLRKAAARATHLAGFPKAPQSQPHSKMLLGAKHIRLHEVDDQVCQTLAA